MSPVIRRTPLAAHRPLNRFSMLLVAAVITTTGLLPIATRSAMAQASPAQDLIVQIKNRKVDSDKQVIRTLQGSVVDVTFIADELMELHLHGYDLTIEVVPTVPKVMHFTADIAGRFPIESHSFGTGTRRTHRQSVLLYLEVQPK
jgi:hypothetical protein